MEFDGLVKRVGFGRAVVISEKELPPEFWRMLDFDRWLEIYLDSPIGSELQKRAITRMLELGTFADWQEVYRNNPEGGKIKVMALDNMARLMEKERRGL